MKFPDSVLVRVTDDLTNAPVKQAAVLLTLLAERKNDYGVGPLLTDAAGLVTFTRLACERAIHTARAMFLMDYASELAECQESVRFELHDPDHLSAMMRQYHETPDFWGQGIDNASAYFDALRFAQNRFYEPASVVVTEAALASGATVGLRTRPRLLPRPSYPANFVADIEIDPETPMVTQGIRSGFRSPLEMPWDTECCYDCALWFEDREFLPRGGTARASIWLTNPDAVVPRLQVGQTFRLWRLGRGRVVSVRVV